MSGVAISGIEVGPVFFRDLLDHVFAANEVGAGRFGLPQLFAARNHQNYLRFAQSMRKHDRSPHHLIGMLGIDPQPQRHFHRLIELCEFHFLQKWNRILQRVRPRFNCLARLHEFLPDFFSSLSLPPPLRCSEGPWCL